MKPDSAIAAEINPDIAEWSTIFKTNVLLADIYDAIVWFNATALAKGTGKHPVKPDPYPRSWRKPQKAFKTIMKLKDWFGMIKGGEENG